MQNKFLIQNQNSTNYFFLLLHLSKLKIASSKYFIKLGGRHVRGNSFLEAMSARSLCLLNYNDCFGKIPFHQYCYFKDEEHLIEKLQFLEKNNDFHSELLNYQDLVLENMIENVKNQFEIALFNKKKNLESKRSRINSKKIGIKSILKKSLQSIISNFKTDKSSEIASSILNDYI